MPNKPMSERIEEFEISLINQPFVEVIVVEALTALEIAERLWGKARLLCEEGKRGGQSNVD